MQGLEFQWNLEKYFKKNSCSDCSNLSARGVERVLPGYLVFGAKAKFIASWFLKHDFCIFFATLDEFFKFLKLPTYILQTYLRQKTCTMRVCFKRYFSQIKN